MRSLHDTITRLTAARTRTSDTMPHAGGPLSRLSNFGSNPGDLAALHFVPEHSRGAPLVVVLHGCTQNASGYDRGTGWTELAEELGFAVLFPEQKRANNPNLCFNWYQATDNRRDAGEPMSIRQMVDAMADRFEIDRSRIYITGLSAGGAMTSVMLATYPDVFAGGAIIAGLPHGSATSLPEAFDRMRGHGGQTADGLVQRVSSATAHAGPWPTISVWHGSADATVDASNADAIIEQWRPFHGVGSTPSHIEKGPGFCRRAWHDELGRTVIDDWRIAGMGHGTPVSVRGDDACGKGGPYMLDVGISSTREIARSWGLGAGKPGTVRSRNAEPGMIVQSKPLAPDGRGARIAPGPSTTFRMTETPTGVAKVIDDALRAAGLMR